MWICSFLSTIFVDYSIGILYIVFTIHPVHVHSCSLYLHVYFARPVARMNQEFQRFFFKTNLVSQRCAMDDHLCPKLCFIKSWAHGSKRCLRHKILQNRKTLPKMGNFVHHIDGGGQTHFFNVLKYVISDKFFRYGGSKFRPERWRTEVLDFCTGSHKSSSLTHRKSRTPNNRVPVLRNPSKYGWMSCSLNEINLNQLRHLLQAWRVPLYVVTTAPSIGTVTTASNPVATSESGPSITKATAGTTSTPA